MAVTGSASGLHISNGSNAESQTMLQIIASNENSVLTAHVIRNGREITDECADSAFTWTCTGGSSTRFPLHAKQISLTSAETAAGVQIACAYSETMGSYGTVQVDNNLTASHTPSTADANDTFVIENGKLKVTTASANGTDYTLNNGRLTVNNDFTGTITSTAAFTEGAQTREIDYTYDHNGLRTGKVVTEGEKTETTEYMLHGKLITHMTRRTAPISETVIDKAIPWVWQKMHFFYDAQSRPAFVEYDGIRYRYLHNLQGDIVGIVDGNGNLVVEYRYDAWGRPISITGTLKTTLGELNPFRYRGYVWDTESGLYYLRSRYYNMITCRFINKDDYYGELAQCYPHNLFCYCANTPICYSDRNGRYPVNVSEIKQYFEYIRSLIKRLKEKIKSIKEVIRKTRGNYPCIPERATPKISAGIKYISKNSVKSEDITGIMIGKFPKIGDIISDLSSIMGAGQPKLNSGTYGFIQYSYEWAYIAADGTIHPQYVRATQYFTADPSSEDIFVYEDELVDPFNLVTPLMEVYY